MRRRSVVPFVVGAALGSCVSAANARAEDLATALRAVLSRQDAAVERGNVDGTLKEMHTQAPGYVQTLKVTKDLLGPFRLKSETTELRLVGTEGEYAFARGTNKVTKVSGPAFKDNVGDYLYVFRKEGPDWKIWTQVTLSRNFLEEK